MPLNSAAKSLGVAVILPNLRAEGGPALAADLCACWVTTGIRPQVILLNDHSMDMAGRFRSLGVPLTVLGVDDISPRSYFQLASKLYSALRRSPVQALVSIPSGVHGLIFAAARLAGVRNSVVHVGNYPWYWKSDFWKYRLLMRLSRPFTPHLVCVTEHVRSGVSECFGKVAGSIHVVANGIDLDRFSGKRHADVSGAEFVVLMVGRLDDGKDHEALFSAIRSLRDRNVPVRLKIAGDGVNRGTLEAQAAILGLEDKIDFLGARSDVPALLAQADVFAFSVRLEEGLGIALVEAMAAGVPVVASDVGACREVLDNGSCGLLVEPGNPTALAEGIERLLFDSGLARELTARARARVEAVYDRRVMARRYAEICGLA